MRPALAILIGIALSAAAAWAENHEADEAKKTTTSEEAKPITTASGLIYTEVEAGSGPHPKRTDAVKVHYHGTLENGKVFDSSVERGQPARFPLNRVIPCWTEGLQKMRPGGRAILVCPPKIAYGARGAPPRIPPNATLTFEVELIDIVN
jgi:FKBP-type peptidyl-prolyl cis-trans isomerase FkpA